MKCLWHKCRIELINTDWCGHISIIATGNKCIKILCFVHTYHRRDFIYYMYSDCGQILLNEAQFSINQTLFSITLIFACNNFLWFILMANKNITYIHTCCTSNNILKSIFDNTVKITYGFYNMYIINNILFM